MIEKTKAPRGIRNNNPGNIEFNARVQWEGQTGTDGRFATFTRPEDGLRAVAKVLLNYQRKHGLNTVRELLTRYAPAFENDTGSYIDHVAARIGVTPDTSIDVAANLEPLLRAIVAHENGHGWDGHYSMETYRTAIQRAVGAA